MIYFNALPFLHTERLLLRPIVESDAEQIFRFTSQKDTVRFLSWEAHESVLTTKNFVKSVLDRYQNNQPAQWAIVLKEKMEVIGITGFVDFSEEHAKGEIAFVMSAAFEGRGYMTEANKAVLDNAFSTFKLNRIQAKAEIENISSQKVLEKIGMRKEGVLKDFLKVKGTFRTYILYALVQSKATE